MVASAEHVGHATSITAISNMDDERLRYHCYSLSSMRSAICSTNGRLSCGIVHGEDILYRGTDVGRKLNRGGKQVGFGESKRGV